jgi:hypothetical protein
MAPLWEMNRVATLFYQDQELELAKLQNNFRKLRSLLTKVGILTTTTASRNYPEVERTNPAYVGKTYDLVL